ncbi:MAG: acetate--CoA ligase family protein [Promethearchaeota archaeon]
MGGVKITKQDTIIKDVLNQNRTFLMEHESKDLIAKYDIPVGEYKVVKDEYEAVKFANKIGYPVVAKLMSPDIIHKTEARVIKLNLNSDEEVRKAYKEVIHNGKNYNSEAQIEGVNIQKMMEEGLVEIIIGSIRDINFGPVLMFGLGGIFVEIFKDVSYRVCPISQGEASKMIRNIKAFPLLDGYRGQPKADNEKIIEVLLKCCHLLIENPEIEELDLNPVIVFEKGKGLMVLDARIILREDL